MIFLQKKYQFFTFIFVLVFLACDKAYSASGTVSVSGELTVLSLDMPSKVITVRNTNKTEPAYIDSRIVEIISVIDGVESLQDVTDKFENNLIVTPKKFIIAPNSRVNVRLVFNSLLDKMDEDRYFKVRFQPQQAFETQEVSGNSNNIKSEVFLSIGVSSLVAVTKSDKETSILSRQNGSSTLIENIGDSVVTLDNCKVCSVKGDCDFLGQIRLIPGRVREIIDGDKVVDYKCFYNNYQGPVELISGP